MTPPTLATWLLALAAGRRERADVLSDLAEEASGIAGREGDRAARRWYWRQAFLSAGPLLRRRAAGAFRLPSAGVIRTHLIFTLRSLRGSPAFSAAVVLLLALAIGAHAVVYAVVDGLVLRPLPFGDRSPRLITIHATHPTLATDWDDSEISYPDLLDLRRESTTLEGLEGLIGRNVSISNGRDAERVLAASVTPGLFALLGVAPERGRAFSDADAAAIGAETTVIISHALWQSLLGADAAAIGGRVTLNGRPLTVIGVMPPQFSFPEGQQVWLPFRADPVDGRSRRNILAVGLIRTGVPVPQSLADLKHVAARLADRHPDTNRDWSVHALPMRDFFVSGADAETVLGAMTLVLLVACANVAGLIVARGIGRGPEIGLRSALGASRFRLAALLATESAVLAVVAGALGILLARVGIRALLAWIPEPPPYWAQPVLDWRVMSFMILLTAAVAVLSGFVPAIRLSRVDAQSALAPGARTTSTRGHRRLQSVLVVGQVAASLALLVGALLLSRSATAILSADGGFAVAPLASARFYIAGDRYDSPDARSRVVNDVVQAVAAIPGVRAAAATGSIPTDDGGEGIRIEVGERVTAAREAGAQLVPVSPGFWDALAIRLEDGRTFTSTESEHPGTDAIIVNRRLADLVWPGETAIGRTLPVTRASESFTGRVIGVAPNLVYEEFGEETPQSQLIVYVPNGRAGWRTHALLVSASGDPAVIAPEIRSAVRAVDPGFATYDVLTMADRRAYNHWLDRFMGRTFLAFAIAALVLAAIGAYGVVAYTAAQRKREIGIRLAIGASRGSVINLFLGAGGRLAVAGLGLGLPLAYVVARVFEGELFRVSPWTADVWTVPPFVLALVILAAVYLPARRASRANPIEALRT